MINQNETAIQNKQQSTDLIISEIIKLFATHNLTVEDSDYVLRNVSKTIRKQKVTL